MIQGKTIFITGGAGFIANTLIKHYISNNNIIVYDNFHRDTLSSSEVAHHQNLKVVKGDVLDYEFLKESMKGADIVVHAAGIAGIDTVIKDPVSLRKRIEKSIRPGMIVLLHDSLPQTAAMLPELISSLQQKGITFTTAEELKNWQS